METDTTASDKDSKLLVISGSAVINRVAAAKFWLLNLCFSLETFGIIYEKQTRLNIFYKGAIERLPFDVHFHFFSKDTIDPK